MKDNITGKALGGVYRSTSDEVPSYLQYAYLVTEITVKIWIQDMVQTTPTVNY